MPGPTPAHRRAARGEAGPNHLQRHYSGFGPPDQNGQARFIKDSQMLEIAAGNQSGHREKREFLNQSNRLDTDSSAAVRPIASPIRVAIDRPRTLRATRTASVGWIESVMTSSLSWEAVTRATAPPDRTPWLI